MKRKASTKFWVSDRSSQHSTQMVKQAKENPVPNHCGRKWYTEAMRAGVGETAKKNVITKPEDAFMNQW